jgi:hypothetical protein
VGADRHPGRALGDRGVDQSRIAPRQLVRIIAAGARSRAQLRIAQVRKVGVVELNIGAAGRGERAQLFAVGRGDVGKECLEVRVGLAADRLAPAAEVQHGRRGERHLRRARGGRPEEVEVRELDRAHVAHLPGHVQHRWGEVDVALGAVKVRGQSTARFHPVELLEEIDMEIRAPELAVGNALQPDVFLHADDIGDRRVLDRAQRRAVERAVVKALAGGEQRRRAQKAADVVGAKRGRSALAHGRVRHRGREPGRRFRTRR